MPTNIGDEERILSYRQNIVQDKLLKCYAEKIESMISNLVVENCSGCIIDHPSQRHDCHMMESDE